MMERVRRLRARVNVAREDWELQGRDAAHVDHVTDDLVGFLGGCGEAVLGDAR
jgi:hypothetical protein